MPAWYKIMIPLATSSQGERVDESWAQGRESVQGNVQVFIEPIYGSFR